MFLLCLASFQNMFVQLIHTVLCVLVHLFSQRYSIILYWYTTTDVAILVLMYILVVSRFVFIFAVVNLAAVNILAHIIVNMCVNSCRVYI